MLDRIREAWGKKHIPLAVLPTGAGKTVVFSRALHDHPGVSVVMAHRRELVGQIALALHRQGARFQILAPRATVRQIIRSIETREGACNYDPNARITVASVDSMRRADPAWKRTVSLWVFDEAHHVLKGNKWGRALEGFPAHARGLGVTATPTRADKAGLGDHADGVFDEIVQGPLMRELIQAGHLCKYKAFAPGQIDLSKVKVSSNGDYSRRQLASVVGNAGITGDVVGHYLEHARGKRGVTFAVSVEACHEIAQAYRDAGVPAAAVHAKTPAAEREDAIRKLETGELLQLVNVDLFGEGFDLPAIDCASFARPTKSYALYVQQFGRALRNSPGKTHALIFDHVGNILEHGGPPDIPQTWTLDRAVKKQKAELSPYRTCNECTYVYERTLDGCPACGAVPEKAERSTPDHVAGDLVLLDPDTLQALYDQVAQVDRSEAEVMADARQRRVPEIGVLAARNRHRKLQAAQDDLRAAMFAWSGVQKHAGLNDRQIMAKFYKRFGVDMLTAKTLKPEAAELLRKRIQSAS